MATDILLRNYTVRVSHDDRIVADEHRTERSITTVSGLASECEGPPHMLTVGVVEIGIRHVRTLLRAVK